MSHGLPMDVRVPRCGPQPPPPRWLEHWGLARHAAKRLPAPAACLHVEAGSGAVALANARQSVRLLAFDPLGDPVMAVRCLGCLHNISHVISSGISSGVERLCAVGALWLTSLCDRLLMDTLKMPE